MQEFLIQLHEEDGSEDLTWLVNAVCFEQAAIIAWNERRSTFGGPEQMPEWAKPINISMEVNDNVIHVCDVSLKNAGIDIPRENIIELIHHKESDFLRRALFSYYSTEQCDVMDTADRDYLKQAFAEYIGAKQWPCFSDTGTAIERDFAEKIIAAENAGKIGLSDHMKQVMKLMAQ